MTLLQAFILGIVEGITEFLPISSTGHLILASEWMGLERTEFLKTFEIAIQSGAIFAVLVLYGKSLLNRLQTLRLVIIAFIPTAILGLLLHKLIKKYLFSGSEVVLCSLFIGGILLILFELWYIKREKQVLETGEITSKQAFLVGVFQSLAMIPGVSRSAATIVGGLLLGMSRKAIVEFSFLLAIPTLLAATGLDLLKNASTITSDHILPLTVGLLTSFVVALLGIKFLIRYIQQHTFIWFGVYRIAVAVFFWMVIR